MYCLERSLIIRYLKKLLERTYMYLKETINSRLYILSGRKPWSYGYCDYRHRYVKQVLSRDLSAFRQNHLPEHYGSRLDERVVEYPWLFSRLKDQEQVVLDAGSALNYKYLLAHPALAWRKMYITTLYYEGRRHGLPSPSYLYEDLRNMSFKDNYFDAICSLSTIEHIGLDNTKIYTPDPSKKENDRQSYLKAIAEFKRVLKKKGTLYLSVPYGKYDNRDWLQVFDQDMITELLKSFQPGQAHITYFKYDNRQWQFSTMEDCRDGIFFDIHSNKNYTADYLAAAQCVACLELVK